MTMQSFASQTGRLNRFKGMTLKHAVPLEVLGKAGRQIELPANSSDTYVARRWLPYGATATDSNTQNRFFQNGTGDRGNVTVQAHLTQEGITPSPDAVIALDIVVVMQQYSCLYGYTDKTALLYEDNVPEQMAMQVGERMTFVNELIIFGTLKACTNQFYGGTGTTRATTNGPITLGLLRRITRNLQANHAVMVNKMLKASANFGTDAVSPGYMVYCHTDLESDIRDLPGYTPIEKYASGTPLPNEIGKCERFRFITSPEFPSIQDSGAAVGSTGLVSQSAVNVDLYQFIVVGQDAWGQIAVRGKGSMLMSDLPPGVASKSDPFGQRGYAGAMWWKAVIIENQGWMAVGTVGAKVLTN